MSRNPESMNANLTFDEFRTMAKDEFLSPNEKIGFPDSYRAGFEEVIISDISRKLLLDRKDIAVLDLGCGCSRLVNLIVESSKNYNQQLYLLDSEEMLTNIKGDLSGITKISGKFPNDCESFKNNMQDKFDVILVYSVMQHVILEFNPFSFIDQLVLLLKPGGRLLLGDLPNISKRNRFFSSAAGVRYHKEFTNTDTNPEVKLLQMEYEKFDDGIIIGILTRYRGFGFETYLLPQSNDMPMANRREDILICRN